MIENKIEMTAEELVKINENSVDQADAVARAFALGATKAGIAAEKHEIKQNPVTYTNCGLDGLEELEGYTIDRIVTLTDESAEGFSIKAHRMIDNVEIGRIFLREEGEYYISGEYVIGIC